MELRRNVFGLNGHEKEFDAAILGIASLIGEDINPLDCILVRNNQPGNGQDPYWKLDGPGFELHLNGTTVSYIAGDTLLELDFRLVNDAKSVLLSLVNWHPDEILECIAETDTGYVFESVTGTHSIDTDGVFMIGEAARCYHIGDELLINYIRR